MMTMQELLPWLVLIWFAFLFIAAIAWWCTWREDNPLRRVEREWDFYMMFYPPDPACPSDPEKRRALSRKHGDANWIKRYIVRKARYLGYADREGEILAWFGYGPGATVSTTDG